MSAAKTCSAMMIDVQEDQVARFRRILLESSVQLVSWVPSGTGWISAWQESKPDIIFVDYLLPKRDGLYCVEKLRALSAHNLVIFTHSFSGAAANDIELKALARGAFAVFQKPGADTQLRRVIEHVVDECLKMKTLKKLRVGGPGAG